MSDAFRAAKLDGRVCLTLDFSRGGAQHFTSRRRLQIFVMQLRQELD
jgi:hypothetical protein